LAPYRPAEDPPLPDPDHAPVLARQGFLGRPGTSDDRPQPQSRGRGRPLPDRGHPAQQQAVEAGSRRPGNKAGSARSPRSRPPWPPPHRNYKTCASSPPGPRARASTSACRTCVRPPGGTVQARDVPITCTQVMGDPGRTQMPMSERVLVEISVPPPTSFPRRERRRGGRSAKPLVLYFEPLCDTIPPLTAAPIRRRALSAWSRTWSGPRRRETSGSPPGSGSPSCPGP
jgi:hypothetical protein